MKENQKQFLMFFLENTSILNIKIEYNEEKDVNFIENNPDTLLCAQSVFRKTFTSTETEPEHRDED